MQVGYGKRGGGSRSLLYVFRIVNAFTRDLYLRKKLLVVVGLRSFRLDPLSKEDFDDSNDERTIYISHLLDSF